jgi:hypothetical protein
MQPQAPPVAQASPGYARGAAVVPPPAPRPAEPTYGYSPQTGPVQPRRRNSATTLLLIVVGALAVLITAAVIAYLAKTALNQQNEDRGSGRTNGQGTTATQQAGGAQKINLPCDDYRGDKDIREVREQLEAQGLRVKEDPRPGGKEGKVESVTPCTATPGQEVTVTYRSGSKGGDVSPSCGGIAAPITGCNPTDDD